MFGNHSKEGYSEIAKGIKIKTLVYGKDLLMTEFLMDKGALVQEHFHLHEQSGYLIKGKIRLYIGEQNRELKPGDSWNIPSNATHKADIIEDSVVIEIFNPVREDYFKFVNVKDVIE